MLRTETMSSGWSGVVGGVGHRINLSTQTLRLMRFNRQCQHNTSSEVLPAAGRNRADSR